MIYLFEDRRDRMNLYLKDNIDVFNYFINSERIIDVKLDELENYLKNLEVLDVIMLHKSYAFLDKRITPQNVKEIAKKLDAKFVLFSGGLNTAIVDDYEIVMNSGDFYNNLPNFLNHYQVSKNYDLTYLVFSTEREINLHQLKKFQNKAFKTILNFNSKEENTKKLFKKVKLFSDEYLLSDSLKPYREKLKVLLEKDIPVNTHTLFNQLQKMIASYENN